MSRYIYQGTTKDGTGKVVCDATISVYLAGGYTVASVYIASTGGGAVNSVTSGSATSSSPGYFSFWVDRGDYVSTQQFRLVISKSGFNSQIYDYISVGVTSQPWVDVKTDFGAAGNGVTDDTAAIQATIDSLYGYAGTVKLTGAGPYLISSPIVLKDGIWLEGDSFFKTEIRAATGFSMITADLSGCGTRNLRVRGAGSGIANGIGFDVGGTDSQHIYAENCDFLDLSIAMQYTHVNSLSARQIRITDCNYGIQLLTTVNSISFYDVDIFNGSIGYYLGVTGSCRNIRIFGGVTQGQTSSGINIVGNLVGFSSYGLYLENCRPQGVIVQSGAKNISFYSPTMVNHADTQDSFQLLGPATIIAPSIENNPTRSAFFINTNVQGSIIENPVFASCTSKYTHGAGTNTKVIENGFAFQSLTTLEDAATPYVYYNNLFLTGGTTTITNFLGGVTGQIITIVSEHAITITDGTNIFLSGSANFVMSATDTLTLIQKADGKWYELSRSDNT